jgi:hypothetical protein
VLAWVAERYVHAPLFRFRNHRSQGLHITPVAANACRVTGVVAQKALQIVYCDRDVTHLISASIRCSRGTESARVSLRFSAVEYRSQRKCSYGPDIQRRYRGGLPDLPSSHQRYCLGGRIMKFSFDSNGSFRRNIDHFPGAAAL